MLTHHRPTRPTDPRLTHRGLIHDRLVRDSMPGHGLIDDQVMDDHTNRPEPELPRLWTVSEVAAVLRVSKMTIYRMVHSGELANVRVGSSYRIPDAAVRGLLDGP